MLPKKKRINTRLFNEIIKNGKVFYGSFFVFKYIKQSYPHYSFVVPKSIAKNSYLRNKYRRIGFNLIKNIDLKDLGGIFFYKKQFKDVKKEDLEKDIVFILNSIK